MNAASVKAPRPVRLLVTPPASGSWNMALDEAILETITAECPLVWRFYEWSPATLSLGYFQSHTERASHSASLACALTRRLSGGGAILHDRELTYSVVVPPGHSWSADVQSLYDRFHRTLIETLGDWRIAARQFSKPVTPPPDDEPFLCFERRAKGDVLLEDWKICGSAQRRRRGAVLQHGSILLNRSEAAPELPGVNDIGSRAIKARELREAWLERFSKQFQFAPEQSEPSQPERVLAEKLMCEKYDCPSWVKKR